LRQIGHPRTSLRHIQRDTIAAMHAASTSAHADKRMQRLLGLRAALLTAQLAGLAVGYYWVGADVAWGGVAAGIAIYAAAALFTAIRLRAKRQASDQEFFFHLLLDVALLTLLLGLTGGPANPFVSLYLLPLVVAAATLPARFAWSTAAISAACYAALFVVAPRASPHHGDPFAIHVAGMWFNFLLSAAIISFFVVRLTQDLQRRDAAIAAQKEQALRSERIVALGALAAGAAHELGTPLSTMATLLKDMERDRQGDSQLARELATLRRQVSDCKQTITRMVAAAGEARAEGGAYRPIDAFLIETLERWRLMRPAVQFSERLDGLQPAPRILAEQTLAQAIVTLLNNAADASPDAVELDARWDAQALVLEIRDRGTGLSSEAQARAGEAFFSTKAKGFGLGLFLARAVADRLGGTLTLRDRATGGATTCLTLPLASLGATGR
jgi:two-component system sensor histidine kinase RegB